jgi:hypothetical protein
LSQVPTTTDLHPADVGSAEPETIKVRRAVKIPTDRARAHRDAKVLRRVTAARDRRVARKPRMAMRRGHHRGLQLAGPHEGRVKPVAHRGRLRTSIDHVD